MPELGSALVVEAVRGLEVVDRQVFPLSQRSPTVPIHCSDGARPHVRDAALPAPGERAGTTRPSQEVSRSATCATAPSARSATGSPTRPGASRRAAWPAAASSPGCPTTTTSSPLTVRTTVDYQGSAAGGRGRAARRLPHARPARASTRSSPPATELEPYVESVYPGATGLLYRREPVVLAFDERFSTLLPVDRTRRPSDPAERTQLLEWVLAVEQADGTRLSVPTADWVVAHRGTAPPPRPWVPWVIDDVLVRRDVRRAPTLNPFAQRLEALELLSPSCGLSDVRLHSSQVLTHAPAGPGASDPTAPLWPAADHAARCRSPQGRARTCSRRPFEDGDETALTVADEGRITSTGWQVAEGMPRCRASRTGPAALRRAGDADWDHVTIQAEVDPADGAAGVAVAVSGLPHVDRALLALVDAASGQLRLLARRGGATQDLESTPLPGGSTAPYALEVFVFDDRVRARVGDDVGRGRSRRPARRSGRAGPRRARSVRGAARRRARRVPHPADHQPVRRVRRAHRQLGRGDPAAAGRRRRRAGTAGRDDRGDRAADGAGADPQLRQRLFDRWVAELAIPLRRPWTVSASAPSGTAAGPDCWCWRAPSRCRSATTYGCR